MVSIPPGDRNAWSVLDKRSDFTHALCYQPPVLLGVEADVTYNYVSTLT